VIRAFGPGSVSSFLKIILDVVYFALCIAVIVIGVLSLGAVLLSFNPGLLARVASQANMPDAARLGPFLPGGLIGLGLKTAGVLLIVRALRKILLTLTAGDPFHPENVGRLRLIGAMLAGLELIRYAVWALSMLAPRVVTRSEPNLNLTAWFSVLVVFVLAEVFREGARLRREAELTI
jgi:hypothetical protein